MYEAQASLTGEPTAFNEEKKCLLNSLKAGGNRLNLNCANTFILYIYGCDPPVDNKRARSGHTAWTKKVLKCARMIARRTPVKEKRIPYSKQKPSQFQNDFKK